MKTQEENYCDYQYIERKVNEATFLMTIIAFVIVLLVYCFYLYINISLPSSIYIGHKTATIFYDFYSQVKSSSCNCSVLQKQDFSKEFLLSFIILLTSRWHTFLLFSIIPTRFELQHPKPKEIEIKIVRLYWRFILQSIHFCCILINSIAVTEIMLIGLDLFNKSYWTSTRFLFVLVAIILFVSHKYWRKIFAEGEIGRAHV